MGKMITVSRQVSTSRWKEDLCPGGMLHSCSDKIMSFIRVNTNKNPKTNIFILFISGTLAQVTTLY